MTRKKLLLPGLILASCGFQPSNAAAPQPPQPRVPATAAEGVTIKEETESLIFAYSWPAAAAAIKPLDRQLRAEMTALKTEALEIVAEDRKMRVEMEMPFNPHAHEKKWQAKGENAALLSLTADTYSSTGGAHPATGLDSLLWDKKAGAPVQPLSLFRDSARAAALIARIYCPALDAARAEKRQETLPLKGDEFLTGCPPVDKQKIGLVDSNGDGRFDVLRVLLPPAEAGPYAEGSYEIDVPVTSALRALVKPGYAAAFGQ